MVKLKSVKISEAHHKTLLAIRKAIRPQPKIGALVEDMIDRYKIRTKRVKR